jgi:choline dehydrogenase-like flavoprotein
VEATVERLIPSEPEWPGASAASVPNDIDLQLAGPYGAGDRLFVGGPIKPRLPGQGYQLGFTPAALYRTSLRAIGEQLSRRGLGFASAPAAEQGAFLTELEAGRLDVGGFSSAVFFETLLANTIEAYFANPAYRGNRDMVSWRMIGFPGAYAAGMRCGSTASRTRQYTNFEGVSMQACIVCGFCERFGCEHFAKASPQTTILPKALSYPTVELRTRAHVTRVLLDRERQRATAVLYRASGGRTAADVRFPHRDAHPHASTGATTDAAGGDSPSGGSGRGGGVTATPHPGEP